MKEVVLLSGAHNSGKTTLASNFSMFYGYYLIELSFIPKTILANSLGLTLQQFEIYKKQNAKINNITYRQLLINYTENMKQYFGSCFWIKKAFEDHSIYDKYIVPDFYYIEEYYYLKMEGFNIISVNITPKVEPKYNLKNFQFDILYDHDFSKTEHDLYNSIYRGKNNA
jgi:hypothetical protein